MQQAQGQPRQLLGAQPLAFGHRRTGGQLLGLLHQRADHVDPVAGRHLGPHPLPHPHLVEGGAGPAGGHRRAARGQLVEHHHVEIAEHHHGGGARDGGGRHDEQVGVGAAAVGAGPPLVAQGGALLHPEAVLLVDDHHPQGGEAHLVPQHRAWVPTTRSSWPSARAALSRVRSAAPVRLVRRAAIATGRRPPSGPGSSATAQPVSERSAPRRRCRSASTSVGTIRAPW